MVTGFVGGADIQFDNKREPALVSVLSIVVSKEPFLEPPIVLISSKLLRVALSISRTSPAFHFWGKSNRGIFPCCVKLRYSTSAPPAATSALEKGPNDSRELTP